MVAIVLFPSSSVSGVARMKTITALLLEQSDHLFKIVKNTCFGADKNSCLDTAPCYGEKSKKTLIRE